MNNYNALGAVIAGINGTAVHRLSLTRELVNPHTQKRFMRLELLMGTHMSHAKYRLAWDNTSSERVPFLPLHRRDLVSAEEGNRTFLQDGDKINWNKFQVMGDVLMVVVKSQSTPYRDLCRNVTVEKLIVDAVSSMNDDVSRVPTPPSRPPSSPLIRQAQTCTINDFPLSAILWGDLILKMSVFAVFRS